MKGVLQKHETGGKERDWEKTETGEKKKTLLRGVTKDHGTWKA